MNVPYNGHVLKLGSRGSPVFAVKRALKKAGFGHGLRPNTLYGVWTDRNVRNFQRAVKLTQDGQVGKLTLHQLAPYFDNFGYQLYTGHPPPDEFAVLLPAFLTFPTHETAGLPGFPANDLFAPPGTQVVVPADCRLVWPHLIPWDEQARVGGETCYLQYASPAQTAFVTHLGMVNIRGGYAAGDVIGTVGKVPGGWWASHVHYGLHQGRYEPPQP